MRKRSAIKSVLEHKATSYLLMMLFAAVVFFTVWNLVERHKAQLKTRQAHYDYARALKQKAITHAENDQWELAILYSVNSMVYQAKAKKYLPMDDIELPPGFKKQLLGYLMQNPEYTTKNADELLKTVEQQTGLVLDGDMPVAAGIYYSLDLDYYKNCGKYNNALEAYNAAENFHRIGSGYLEEQKFAAAVSAFKEALTIRPRFKEVLNKLGWTYHFTGEKRKAKKIYKKAKAVDVDFYLNWNAAQWADTGDNQKSSGNYGEAERSYENALKINPHYYRAWNSLGEMYESLDRFDKAIRVYREAHTAIPGSSREWQGRISYNRGLEYFRTGQYSRASGTLKQAVELYPGLDRAWLKLAEAYHKGKKIPYHGRKWDFHFDNADLKIALSGIARQAQQSFLIDPDVKGKITCELDQVEWDKALELFLKINDCEKCDIANITRIGKVEAIEQFLKEKGKSSQKNQAQDNKKFSGTPLDLSFCGDDINFVLQMIAAKVNVKIIVDPGINYSIWCEFFQVPWDMAVDVILEANNLARFQLGNLVRVGERDLIEGMCTNEKGLLTLIRSLLRLDRGQVNVRDEKGKTVLFLAARLGFSRLAEFLISRGADVNARDNWNFTPLHEVGNRETAEVLINAGADLHAKSNTGLTPLRAAVYGMKPEVAKFLAAKGARSTIFLDAAMGRLEAVKKVVNRDEKIIHSVDPDGWTLLHHAAAAGRYQVVDFLISRGADINAADPKGETPLHMAVSRGRDRVVKRLILCGAEVNPRNKFGDTPLGIAQSRDDKAIIKLLKKYGGKE